jgi:tetratricopeptide (TPR) repeat protein
MDTLALSMIVKNGATDLAYCLASVRGVVDEIVVADTGSSDGSPQIAREFGARVIHIPWDDDFSKARNLSLAEVRSDWVVVLDADERLDGGAKQHLPALFAHKGVSGYQVTIRNWVTNLSTTIWDRSALPNDGSYAAASHLPGFVDHENVRMFRRSKEIYFTGRVHETVGWRIQESGRAIGSSPLRIHHMGMLRDTQERARKIQFYRDLGKQKVADMPSNAQAHFELGVAELENFGNLREALASFENSCRINPKFGVAWFFLGVCHFRLGEFPRALDCFQRAERFAHATALTAEMTGDAFYNLGDFESACACYRRGLKRAESSTSLESKLGVAEARCGNERSGLRRIRQCIEKEPANPELYDRLISVQVWLKDLSAAAFTAERKLSSVVARAEDFLRAASIRAQMKDWTHAATILGDGVREFPDYEPLRTNLFKIETLINSAAQGLAEKARV